MRRGDLLSGTELHSPGAPGLRSGSGAERVRAGFPDALADEGPSAGPASLAGLSSAREKGWSARSTADDANKGDQVADTKVGAAEQADTSRAESETLVETESSEERASDRATDPEIGRAHV